MKLTINKHHTRRKNLKTRKPFIPGRFFKAKTVVTYVVITNMQKDFSVLLAYISAKIVINWAILEACATRSKNPTRKGPAHPAHPKHTS